MLKLTAADVEVFRPEREGWVSEILIRLDEFPEIKGRPMVFQRDAYKRGDDRMVIEWERDWTLRAIARNGHWFDGDITFERLYMLMREVVLNGQTAVEWLNEQFEHELCGECHGDVDDHLAQPDMFGNWHAWCLFNAPRMMRFAVAPMPMQRETDDVRMRITIERTDTQEVVAETEETITRSGVPFSVQYFESAIDEAMDPQIQSAAQVLLMDYRQKKHNES